MKRLAILVLISAAAIAAYLWQSTTPASITLSEATAAPVMGSKTLVISVTMTNLDRPDRLIAVNVPKSDLTMLTNPLPNPVTLVVPGNSSASLAMDGAHVMARMPRTAEEGGFVPLVLTFEHAGTLSTRAQIAAPAAMDHSAQNGVRDALPPKLTARWQTPPSGSGAVLSLTTENFAFVRVEDSAPHVPGQGHAHVYLNGLKLGRLYAPNFTLGALSPGRYTLTVALNTNDHRPYLDAAGPITATLAFLITEN